MFGDVLSNDTCIVDDATKLVFVYILLPLADFILYGIFYVMSILAGILIIAKVRSAIRQELLEIRAVLLPHSRASVVHI